MPVLSYMCICVISDMNSWMLIIFCIVNIYNKILMHIRYKFTLCHNRVHWTIFAVLNSFLLEIPTDLKSCFCQSLLSPENTTILWPKTLNFALLCHCEEYLLVHCIQLSWYDTNVSFYSPVGWVIQKSIASNDEQIVCAVHSCILLSIPHNSIVQILV